MHSYMNRLQFMCKEIYISDKISISKLSGCLDFCNSATVAIKIYIVNMFLYEHDVYI